MQVEEEEEEKEQCSPVSVLDPPFEDDDDRHVDDDENEGFDLECSYAIVQSTFLNHFNLFLYHSFWFVRSLSVNFAVIHIHAFV